MISGVESVVRERLGDAVFGVDEETVDDLLEALLRERGWSLECVEVSTIGLVTSRLARLSSFAGSTIIPSRGESDVEADARARLDDYQSTAEVTLIVGEVTEQETDEGTAAREIGVAIRTPDREVVTSLHALGDDERARTFAVSGALHLLRKSLLSE